MSTIATPGRSIFWHRELPPLDAEPLGTHTLEATSDRIAIADRDELWDRCRATLEAHVYERLQQEIARLGGDCARIIDEDLEPKRDDANGEIWLYGRFEYVLYRHESAVSLQSR